ncbi:hypothetical protein BV898_16161 [Hypsibius exemplaris]|uniref:Uncharacterized protein n=1 Tax=Hypsibius exemplaris TaxID=2072580 RepID=A0A9X6NES1_HYPEX|nr:hypothetical protein BV898_16161 [Hypsibius exemplaris]
MLTCLTALVFGTFCMLPGASAACSCPHQSLGALGNAFSQLGSSGDYCCYSNQGSIRVGRCCDFTDYLENTTGLDIGGLVGIIIGCLVVLALIIIFICCCCGWCCFASCACALC